MHNVYCKNSQFLGIGIHLFQAIKNKTKTTQKTNKKNTDTSNLIKILSHKLIGKY